MKKVLVTGGTGFVSGYVATYYVKAGYEVYVLNRNSKEQYDDVILIEGDRSQLCDKLKGYHFDVVFDVTTFNANDITCLLDALDSFDEYIMISSSAVYPEHCVQPFAEDTTLGVNKYWGKYGTDKIEAEAILMERVPNAYILRPPYLYGPMNNVYREAFVFDCAMQGRKFYLPKDGDMKLQFFYIEDLCRFMDVILEKKPSQHILNVGNPTSISVKEWVELCYQVVGKEAEFVNVYDEIEQRQYFSFYNYEYALDVQKQEAIMPDIKPLKEGLQEALTWYSKNSDKVWKKPYMEFIDRELL